MCFRIITAITGHHLSLVWLFLLPLHSPTFFLLIFKEADGVTLWPSADMNRQYFQQLIIRAWNEKPYIAGPVKFWALCCCLGDCGRNNVHTALGWACQLGQLPEKWATTPGAAGIIQPSWDPADCAAVKPMPCKSDGQAHSPYFYQFPNCLLQALGGSIAVALATKA